jgi:hypothetical protein
VSGTTEQLQGVSADEGATCVASMPLRPARMKVVVNDLGVNTIGSMSLPQADTLTGHEGAQCLIR